MPLYRYHHSAFFTMLCLLSLCIIFTSVSSQPPCAAASSTPTCKVACTSTELPCHRRPYKHIIYSERCKIRTGVYGKRYICSKQPKSGKTDKKTGKIGAKKIKSGGKKTKTKTKTIKKTRKTAVEEIKMKSPWEDYTYIDEIFTKFKTDDEEVILALQEEKSWLKHRKAEVITEEEMVANPGVFKLSNEDGIILLKKKYNADLGELVQKKQYTSDYLGDDVFYKLYNRFNTAMLPEMIDTEINVDKALDVSVETDPEYGTWVVYNAFYRTWFGDWQDYKHIVVGEWDYNNLRLFNIAQVSCIIITDRMLGNADRINRKLWADPTQIDRIPAEWNDGNLMRKTIGKGAGAVQFVTPLDNSVNYALVSGLYDHRLWKHAFEHDLASIENLRRFFLNTITNPENEGIFPLKKDEADQVVEHIADIMTFAIQRFGETICSDHTMRDLLFTESKLKKILPGTKPCPEIRLHTIYMNDYCERVLKFKLEKEKPVFSEEINWMQTLPEFIAHSRSHSAHSSYLNYYASSQDSEIESIGFNEYKLHDDYHNYLYIIWILEVSFIICVLSVCIGFVCGGVIGYCVKWESFLKHLRMN